MEATETRCTKCNKLIFKSVLYFGILQVKCPRCNSLQSFDTFLPEILSEVRELLITSNFLSGIMQRLDLAANFGRPDLHPLRRAW
jgi:phage FluMu protein Com